MPNLLSENPSKLLSSTVDGCGLSRELRNRTHLALACAANLFLFPFSINNFVEGRLLMGVGSTLIVMLMLFNAWCLSKGKNTCHRNAFVLAICIISFIYICFNRQGALAVFWCYPSVALFYFILPEKQARAVNVLALIALLPEVWQFLERALALRATATLILVSIISAIFVNLLGRQQRQLRELAVKDPLTGVFNRLLLDTFLDRAQHISQRQGTPMTFVSIDIDHFKKINDTYGHDTGDRVLREFSHLLLERVRRTDTIFRLGGEEFLIMLFNANQEAGMQVAEQLRKRVAQADLLDDRTVTASMGVATLQPGELWQSCLRRSDQALYQAKQGGRNRVVTGDIVVCQDQLLAL